MIILGINSYHPDSSAALIADGRLVAAVEEERLNRIKHFAGFPLLSIKYCLREAGVSIKDVDYIIIPRNPLARIFKKMAYGLKIPELAEKRVTGWRKAFDVKTDLSRALDVGVKDIGAKIIKVEHHAAHLASSFFVSGFDDAFLFSMDALGDFASTMWARGCGNKIKVLHEIGFPHSLGLYYTAITQYLGFTNFGDEYKVMGLSSYGVPSFEDEFKNILKIKNNGFEMGLDYFLHHKKHISMDFAGGYPKVDTIFSPYLEKRLGRRRLACEPLEKRHKDIACSLQKRLEEIILHMMDGGEGKSVLCLAGGVAFNCAANGKISNLNKFKDIYVPPAPGDAGLAIGAAFYLWHNMLGKPRNFILTNAFWGPEFGKAEIKAEVEKRRKELIDAGCSIEEVKDTGVLCVNIARHIADGKIVGWFQGRMEFGPRALGDRSILADPRRPEMKDILNERIKHRELFRPFAPSILEEDLNKFFDNASPSPFMSFVSRVKNEKIGLIPAVVHVDGTARVQTVNKDANPVYWRLINEFKNITGIPVLLNTSFNDNEPIICTPAEAFDCFFKTRIDILAMDNFIISR
jgi:carbamoyltransferase